MPTVNHKNIGDVNKYTFLSATVVSVDSDNDTVNITGNVSGANIPLFYHCDDDVEERENGALEGAASAFAEDDEVVVMCEINDVLTIPIRVIGFTDGPKECYNEYLVINCHDFCIVWDCRRNAEANISDPVSGDAISFPCTASDLTNWLAITSIVDTSECYNWVESTGSTYDPGSGLYICNNDGCGEVTFEGGTHCVECSYVRDGSGCGHGSKLIVTTNYVTAEEQAHTSYGSSYIAQLQNLNFSGETSCFRTIRYGGSNYVESIINDGRYNCLGGAHRAASGVCDTYYGKAQWFTQGSALRPLGWPYNAFELEDLDASGTREIESLASGISYHWVTPLGTTDELRVSGTYRDRIHRFVGGTSTQEIYRKEQARTPQQDAQFKIAFYSENSLIQIYIAQVTHYNYTRVGSGYPLVFGAYYDSKERQQKILSVCDWFSDTSEEDPRDQESDDDLSDAISSLMDYAATNVPFTNYQVVSSFSTSLRTTFV